MNQKEKKKLMKKYAIIDVSVGVFGEGFFSALTFFDKKLERFLDSDVYFKFLEYLERTRKKDIK